MRGQLPAGAADQLIRLPAGKKRVALARSFVSHHMGLRAMKGTVNRELAPKPDVDGPQGRAVALAQYQPAEAKEPIRSTSPLRLAAAEACTICPVRDDLGIPEPAWTILSHGARETCEGCGLRDTREACAHCPLVVCLRHAYRTMAREEGLVPHKVF